MYKITGYLKIQHFKNLLPDNARLTRLSRNAVSFDYIASTGHSITGIIYVNTVVAELNRSTGRLTLNTGGYKTRTTKKYINMFLNRFNCGFVYQNKFRWYYNLFNTLTDFDDVIVKIL